MIFKCTIPIQVKFGKVNRTAKKELVNSFTPIYEEKVFSISVFPRPPLTDIEKINWRKQI